MANGFRVDVRSMSHIVYRKRSHNVSFRLTILLILLMFGRKIKANDERSEQININ